MKYCANCGARIDGEHDFCAMCGRKISIQSRGSGAIDDMGLLKNESISDDLFAKMESNVQRVEKKQLSPEEIAAINRQKIIEKEKQEKEFARMYIQKYNSLSDNYVLGFVGALLGGLVGAIPWAIASSTGWFVSWLGFVIAIAASKGYDLMKVKVSTQKIWFVAIAVIVGVLAGQIMSDMIRVAIDGEISGRLWSYLIYIFAHFGDFLSFYASDLVLGLIFAALGGFGVLKGIKKETAVIDKLKERISEETSI